MVRAFANDIHHRNARVDAPPWSPSDIWCLRFVKNTGEPQRGRKSGEQSLTHKLQLPLCVLPLPWLHL